ncbi:hypothetical protein EUX98_g9104 [Antrodiella citrinella]|uniref:Fungal-type protein kinase domain-containing protein n=1 Tax=Antrodiella citrinella TaxID=2447956 RepID=A0A4S4LYC0_9APHY|nr:hypothetical protein EUX98_g9104 [Antrodiella citrinella]
MAYELLSYHPPPAHLYRHDLESFFWVLAWFCAVFNPDLHTVGFIPGWHQNRLQDIGTEKAKFLDSEKEVERVCANTHATYRPFITSWIRYLGIILSDAKDASSTERTNTQRYYALLDAPEDNAPMRSSVVANARRKLLRAREELRDLVTYDAFMQVFTEVPVREL